MGVTAIDEGSVTVQVQSDLLKPLSNFVVQRIVVSFLGLLSLFWLDLGFFFFPSHYCDLRLVYVSYLCVIHTFLFCFQDRGFSVSLAAPGSVDQTDFALCLLSSRIKDVHHRTRPLAPTKA